MQPDAAKHFRYRQIEQFLQARAFAENTCRNYRRQLRAFIDWVGKDWSRVELSDLTSYQLLLEKRSLKKTSKAAALIAIKSMYSWLVKTGQVAQNPSKGVTIPALPEPQSKHLESHEVERLFQAVEGRKTETRDRAILLLWFNAGLRAEEVVRLNVGDYNNVEVMVRDAKHGSDGPVPTDDETHEALVEYLVVRSLEKGVDLTEDDPLFVSYSNRNWGQRISYEGVYKVLKDIAASAGLENIHPHRDRHTYSSRLVEEAVDSYLAMTLMRQRSLKAFQTYNNRVRRKAARTAFCKAKGIEERWSPTDSRSSPLSVEQIMDEWGKKSDGERSLQELLER